MSSLSDSNGSAARGAVTAKPGREYWRSLEQLSDTPEFREFLHREFPAGASELLGEDRRQFIKIMGASMALAGLGLAGCRRWPDEEIAPYARRPDGQDPGVQNKTQHIGALIPTGINKPVTQSHYQVVPEHAE